MAWMNKVLVVTCDIEDFLQREVDLAVSNLGEDWEIVSAQTSQIQLSSGLDAGKVRYVVTITFRKQTLASTLKSS